MPKEVGGKIFYTAEEAKELGFMPSPEEIARNEAILAAFDQTIRETGPAPEGTAPGFGGRFSDDLDGTEWEGWTQDATGQWFDQDGNPVNEGNQ
ncbi:hypothetical protein [Nocardia sp. NPDC049149]|uniref:hypothetical protein n=1 Tax=Nocardia sp. NPDC049149 TaxID=3364315 RepID=UPI00371332B3